jgi:hypothetical protein
MAPKAADGPRCVTRSGRLRKQAKNRSQRPLPKNRFTPSHRDSLIPASAVWDGVRESISVRQRFTRSLARLQRLDSTVATVSLELSTADGMGDGSTSPTGTYLIDPGQQLSPRGLRYQRRSNSSTIRNPENAAGPLSVEAIEEGITAPPTEEERLVAEVKEKNKTIKALQRKLAAMTKANARRESVKLCQKKTLDIQKKRWKELEKVQRTAETKANELEKHNRKLRFDISVDQEIRKILNTDFQEAWEGSERKMLEKKFEELREAVECDVLITRVQPGPEFERKQDLRGIHSSMMAQLKQVQSMAQRIKLKKIEYVLNDELYQRYKETEAMFKAVGRPVDEQLFFHGTRDDNIDAYYPSGPNSHLTIVSLLQASASADSMGGHKPTALHS